MIITVIVMIKPKILELGIQFEGQLLYQMICKQFKRVQKLKKHLKKYKTLLSYYCIISYNRTKTN